MKKILTTIFSFLVLFSLTSCQQLVIGIEETFSYWTNNAAVIDVEIPPGSLIDGEGFFCLPSNKNAQIIFKLHNPQKFDFIMPHDSDAPNDIIVFDENVKGKNGGSPEQGIDYSLVQISSDKIRLEYKKEFLLKNEQGKTNLNPKINLYNKKDKRRFEQNYNYKLRANTVPPKPKWVTTGKIQEGNDWYYVLIFELERISESPDLHRDISEVYLTEGGVQKTPISITVTDNGFNVSGSQGSLIPPDKLIMPLTVHDLTEGDISGFKPIPGESDRKWMLCIKTNTKIKDGSNYVLKIRDIKGLFSAAIEGITNLAKLQPPEIGYDAAMHILLNSGVYTDNENLLAHDNFTISESALISSCFGKTVELKAYNNSYSEKVKINAAVSLKNSPAGYTGNSGSAVSQGNITKIRLDSIPGVDEIYEVKLKAQAPNYADSDEKTYYYKVRKEVRSGNSSWHILKTAVANAKENDTIYINGAISSTNDANNYGEIAVNNSISIQGLNNKTHDIIDANKDGANKPESPHRIFRIKNGVSLSLTSLTLQNGKVDLSGSEDEGGAVNIEVSSVLNLYNTDIKNCEAGRGGAVYNAGTFNISGSSIIEPSVGAAEHTRGKNDVYLPTGKRISLKGSPAVSPAARISPQNYSPVQVLEVTSGSGLSLANEVSKFKVTDDPEGNKWKIDASGKLAKEKTIITSWEELSKAVKNAADNSTLTIGGHIEAEGNTEQIVINKNLTIIGERGKTVDIIDARSKHRIFEIAENKSLTLTNLTLQNGKAGVGGAVMTKNGSVLTLDNTDIKESEAVTGGGAVSTSGTLNIKSGSVISGNKTTGSGGSGGLGGAINITPSGSLIMTGGTIENNTAALGGAVYNGGTFKISGAANISVNSDKNDVYLPENKVITVTGALTQTSVARISPVNSTYTEDRGVVEGDGFALTAEDESKFALTPKTGQTWVIKKHSSKNALVLKRQITEITTWQLLQDAVNAANSGDTIIVKNNLTAGTTTSEIKIKRSLTIRGKVNSITLDADYKHRIFKVYNNAVLKLENITLQKGEKDLGAGIYVTNASLELRDVKIKDCQSKAEAGQGGAIFINNTYGDGKLKISGTSVIENNSAYKGAAIYIDTGTGENIIEGSTLIKGNYFRNATNGLGGAVYINAGTLTMTDGTIENNTASKGGAVYNDGIFKMSGSAKIKVDSSKNDVYLPANKVITVSGDLTQPIAARISPESYPSSSSPTIKVLQEGSGVDLSAQVSKFKVTDSTDGKNWKINNSGQLEEDTPGGKTVTSWSDLKEEVTTGTAEIIIVDGTLEAGNNDYVIKVKRNVTIKGKDNKAVIDAKHKCKIFKVEKNSKLILENIILQNGDATKLSKKERNGGAVDLEEHAFLEIKSGVIIRDNVANQGGGVYIGQNAELLMTGGIIQGNTGNGVSNKAHGGAVYVAGIFKMSGSAQVTPSSDDDEHKRGKNDVYLTNGTSIMLIGSLTSAANQAARITVPDDNYDGDRLVLEAASGVDLPNEAKKFKVTQKDGQNWYVGSNGKLTTTAPGP